MCMLNHSFLPTHLTAQLDVLRQTIRIPQCCRFDRAHRCTIDDFPYRHYNRLSIPDPVILGQDSSPSTRFPVRVTGTSLTCNIREGTCRALLANLIEVLIFFTSISSSFCPSFIWETRDQQRQQRHAVWGKKIP